MPEPLTLEQERELKAALELLAQELEQSLSASGESAKTVDLDEPIGRLSRMDAMQQQKMAMANRQNIQIRQHQVRAALVAIEDGEYGECRKCGDEIGYPRLSVRPEAPFCVTCQASVER